MILANESKTRDAMDVKVLVNFVIGDNRLIGSATTNISDMAAGSEHAFGGELNFPEARRSRGSRWSSRWAAAALPHGRSRGFRQCASCRAPMSPRLVWLHRRRAPERESDEDRSERPALGSRARQCREHHRRRQRLQLRDVAPVGPHVLQDRRGHAAHSGEQGSDRTRVGRSHLPALTASQRERDMLAASPSDSSM